MNYNHLYYFYIAAQELNVTKSAIRLKISQPSLSIQLKIFEKEVGAKLFKKSGRNLKLTETGEVIFSYAKRMFQVGSDLQEFIKSKKSNYQHRLNFAIEDQIEYMFAADMLSRVLNLKDQHSLFFRLSTNTFDQIEKKLLQAEIKVALTTKPFYDPRIEEYREFEMPMGLFISSEEYKNIMRNKRKTFKQLASELNLAFILPGEKSKLRAEIDQFLQKNQLKIKVALESDILSIVSRAIVDGLGIGFMPVVYMQKELSIGVVKQLYPDFKFWKHKIYLVGLKDHRDPMVEVIKLAFEQVADH